MLEILANEALQKELASIADARGQSYDSVVAEARSNLKEIHSRRHGFAVAMFARLSRFICARGYDSEYCFDQHELERVKTLSANTSVVYLITHKTYLDFFVLYDFFYRNYIAPPYIFGGINMAFAGFGRLARAAGGIFIRRSFADSPIYKAVLNYYIQSLINQGGSFSWAIEGTRSRTGKLLHPKLGLLKYVAEAARPLGDDAISYIPVSVSYDQIPDVVAMTEQETGASKKAESLSWFAKYIRQLGKDHGKIYLRFGEAIAISQTPDAPDLKLSQQIETPDVVEVQKLAFEVCYLINEITPATTVSLTLLSLLCHNSASKERVVADVDTLQSYLLENKRTSVLKHHSLPTEQEVDKALSMLVANSLLQTTEEGNEYSIVPVRFLVALYYSNMAVHHFVVSAFIELGLINMAFTKSAQPHSAFSAEVMSLRDLFKYEFFFSRKDQFQTQLNEELQWFGAPVESFNSLEAQDAEAILKRQPLLIAHGVLSPFIYAYLLIAKKLLEHKSEPIDNRKSFIESCRLTTEGTDDEGHDIASNTLLNNGYLLAENRGLLRVSDGINAKRKEFVDELQQILDQLLLIKELNG